MIAYRGHTIKTQMGVGEREVGQTSGKAYYIATVACTLTDTTIKGQHRHDGKQSAQKAAKRFIDKRLAVGELEIILADQPPIEF